MMLQAYLLVRAGEVPRMWSRAEAGTNQNPRQRPTRNHCLGLPASAESCSSHAAIQGRLLG